MNRLRQQHCETMAEALKLVPARFRPYVQSDFFCGDPFFAGLYKPPFGREIDLRNYAHVGYSHNTHDKRTMIVWPLGQHMPVTTAVHEMGHVLTEHLAMRASWTDLPLLYNQTHYAQTNYWECFAEAFTIYCCYRPQFVDDHPHYFPWGFNRHNTEFFDRLFLT